MRRLGLVALLLAGTLIPAAPTPSSAQAARPAVSTGEVTVIADRMESLGADNLLVAEGNVELRRGTARLTADRLELNRETGDAVASGRVIFYDGDEQLRGDRVEYNYKTGTGTVIGGEARSAPYYRIGGERMERLGEGVYRIRRGFLTTCEDDPPTWAFHAGEATADLADHVYGTDAAFSVKGVPIIPWFPAFAAAIRRERQTGFLFPRFGTSSRKGIYAEIPFYWAISDSQDATLTLNAYTKKGVGLTADYRYVLSETQRGSAGGFVIGEIADDGGLRGWWTLRHDWEARPDLSIKADINGVSDDTILRDYGDRLQTRSLQRVESNVFVTRSWPSWNLIGNLFWYQDLTTTRPTALHRLPEIRLDGFFQPLPYVPGMLYAVESSAVNFVRAVGSDGTRFDVHPRLAYPISVDGLFTVTPFVGARATAYSTTVTGSRVTSAGIAVETTNGDARVRTLLEAGADVEAKLSRVYALGGLGGIDALLHTIEPRVNYTYLGGNNTTGLPQWTAIDAIPEMSMVTYSVTNRVFARSVAPPGTEAARWEFARLLLGSSYDLRASSRPAGDLVADLIVNMSRWVSFRGDTRYDVHGGGFMTGTTDIGVAVAPVAASVGTRFDKVNRVNFVQAGVRLDLTRYVTVGWATNWDARERVAVENRFGAEIKFQCWAVSVEWVKRHHDEDEVRFSINLLGMGSPLGSSARPVGQR